jgi:hypothetical protein
MNILLRYKYLVLLNTEFQSDWATTLYEVLIILYSCQHMELSVFSFLPLEWVWESGLPDSEAYAVS